MSRVAVSGSTEFDVDASPEQVMDAVAAVEDLPQRSPSHKSAEIETRHEDGQWRLTHRQADTRVGRQSGESVLEDR